MLDGHLGQVQVFARSARSRQLGLAIPAIQCTITYFFNVITRREILLLWQVSFLYFDALRGGVRISSLTMLSEVPG